jgi:hypothetical protein
MVLETSAYSLGIKLKAYRIPTTSQSIKSAVYSILKVVGNEKIGRSGESNVRI